MTKKNTQGGKNYKKKKNFATVAKELLLKEEGQEYAHVTKMLGNGRVEASCLDGETRLCHIRGKMFNKVWISVGDTILIGLRDFQDKKADIIAKYTPEDVTKLKKMGELPEGGYNADINTETTTDDSIPFDFEGI